MKLRFMTVAGCLALWLLACSVCFGQVVPETVFFDVPDALEPNPIPAPTAQLLAVGGYPVDPDRLTLIAALYLPDPLLHGPGPYPAVVVLHGSGGMWSNDLIASGPSNQFEDWGEVLADLGYVCLITDSYNPRGIPGGFSGRRPSYDPAVDDALCSPNYERPKDVVAALEYLATRADVDVTRTALLGFSHGAQTGLNAILDVSVDLSPYTVSYIPNAQDDPIPLIVPSPVRLPAHIPFPRVCVFYYPGCSHFAYHGQASSIAAGRYMPDRRTEVLMYHGTNDSLLGVVDPDASPLTGDLYPIKFVLSSAAQAAVLALPNPFVQHLIIDKANHSFDGTTIEPPQNWNTGAESIDEKSKRLARDEVLKWFEFRLKPANFAIGPDLNNPGLFEVSWSARTNLRYKVLHNDDLGLVWPQQGGDHIGAGTTLAAPVQVQPSGKVFYKLEYGPVEPPLADPNNIGFFRPYGDFSY